MSNRYDIHCINCGTHVKTIRVSSEKEDVVKIDCSACNILSTVYTNDDEEMNQATVEISADKKTIWKNIDLNLEPIFTCPLCGHFGLKTSENKLSDFFQCNGKKCKRIIEVMYT